MEERKRDSADRVFRLRRRRRKIPVPIASSRWGELVCDLILSNRLGKRENRREKDLVFRRVLTFSGDSGDGFLRVRYQTWSSLRALQASGLSFLFWLTFRELDFWVSYCYHGFTVNSDNSDIPYWFPTPLMFGFLEFEAWESLGRDFMVSAFWWLRTEVWLRSLFHFPWSSL